MRNKNKERRILKWILTITSLVILTVILVLFLLNNQKDNKVIKYVENLLEVKINRYVTTGKGKIVKEKNKEYVDLKFEIKGYDIDKFKRELDGKMNNYALNSEVYLEKYVEAAKKYAGDMEIDSFYQLDVGDRSIIGMICEIGGQYYFLMIG